VTIYNTSDWSKLANPGTLPAGTAYGIAFTPCYPYKLSGLGDFNAVMGVQKNNIGTINGVG
jgi:hypothetical protein